MKYPPAIQAQIDAQIARTPKRTSQRVATSGTTSAWRCARCGEQFTTWASAERHNEGKGRIECDIGAW